MRVLALLLLAGPLAAQAPSPMDRFALWVGEWKGAGWSLDATGKRTDFTLTESVRPRVGGTVLLVEGHGTNTATQAVTHDGLTLVYFDRQSGSYRWHGHEVARSAMDAEAVPAENGVAWSIPAGPGGGTVRFTIQWDARRWHEVGEFSSDGKHWALFMEMLLDRVP